MGASVACFQASPGRSVGHYKTYVVASKVVDGSLGQHAVVLELALSERRSVASNDDQLGLAGSQRLEGRLVSESDWKRQLATGAAKCDSRESGDIPFPDFITSANLELMLLASFLLFLTGAILIDFGGASDDLAAGLMRMLKTRHTEISKSSWTFFVFFAGWRQVGRGKGYSAPQPMSADLPFW